MTDISWSFCHRSDTRTYNASDSGEDDDGNLGDAATPSRLSSGTSFLQEIELTGRGDSAHYSRNPWAIARANAAIRYQQPNASVNPVPREPVTKKPPQGAIVDAFKKQAQKPTKSSAGANLPKNPSQNPTLVSVNGALDNLVAVPARSFTPTAHITTSNVNSVPIPSQPPTTGQRQSCPLSHFLPRKVSPVPHPSKPTPRPTNPHFTPNLKRVLPFSSPGPPPSHPQCSNLSASKLHLVPAHAPGQFLPYMPQHQTTTPSSMHSTTNHPVPISSACQESKNLTHPSQSYHRPTSMKSERKPTSPYPSQNTRLPPRPRSNQLFTKASPKSEKFPSSPSFAQARHFFQHGLPPVTTIRQPSPESPPPKEEPRPTPPPPRPRIKSPPRKRTDAYDQLPPSPDSEWSTLRPPKRKANNRTKPKAPDTEGGKFRLPLSLGTIKPNVSPPQKKARVVTYLPPPPAKKQKIMAEPHPSIWTRGLLSPPPSDETAPPSSPTPSVQFDSGDVCTRYKIVRAKIRQVRMPDERRHSLVMPFDLFLCDFVLSFTPVAEGARRSTLGCPRVGQLRCHLPGS
jgi:hypothetical protein